MSRIIKILCRIMAVLTSLWVLKPAVDVYADTGKTYHSKTGAYLIAQCEFFAWVAEQAGRFRDSGGSMEQFIDIFKKQSVNDEPQVKEDKINNAQVGAELAYEMPSLSPQELRNLAMTACIKDQIIRMAKYQGHQIAIVRSCGIDSLEHETLVNEIFQLLTTDATILAAGRKQMQDSIETALGQITKINATIPWSVDDYRQRVCTQEMLDGFKRTISSLASDKQELLEHIAKDKRNR